MEDIVKAIEKLAKKDIIDYLLVIVPIAISIVAIVISIATARKQNKIALFEKRYNCLFQIKTVLAFSKAIEKTFNRTVIIALFDSFWGTNVAYLSEKEQFAIAMSQTEVVKKDIEQAPFLFKYNSIVPLRDIISSFQSVIVSAVYNKGMDASRNNFVSLCKEFIEKDLEHFKVFMKL